MPTLSARKDNGTTIKAGPMVVAGPPQTVTEDAAADFAAGSGLNGPFLADLLSSCIVHERVCVDTLRAFSSITTNPKLRGKYLELADETITAVGMWETLITELGGSHSYTSPAARMTESIDGKLLEAFLLPGSADRATIDLKSVEAVVLATTICLTNGKSLDLAAQAADAGSARSAMEQAHARLAPPAAQHLAWAVETQLDMVGVQVRSSMAQKAVGTVENLAADVKRKLHE